MYILNRSSIQLIDTVVATGGGGGGSLPAAPGTMIPEDGIIPEDTTQVILPGAYKVTVWNTGLTDITVNNKTYPPGQSFMLEFAINKTNNKQDFTPTITVEVPTGGEANYIAYRPSL